MMNIPHSSRVHTWHDTHSCRLRGTTVLITDNCNTPRNESGKRRSRSVSVEGRLWCILYYLVSSRKACLPTRKGFDSFFGSLTGSVDHYRWGCCDCDFFRIETNLVLLFLARMSPICPSATSPAMARVLVGTTSTMVRGWPGARKGSTRLRSSHKELVRSWRATTPRKGRSSCCSHFRLALLLAAGSSSHRSHLNRFHLVGIWPRPVSFLWGERGGISGWG